MRKLICDIFNRTTIASRSKPHTNAYCFNDYRFEFFFFLQRLLPIVYGHNKNSIVFTVVKKKKPVPSFSYLSQSYWLYTAGDYVNVMTTNYLLCYLIGRETHVATDFFFYYNFYSTQNTFIYSQFIRLKQV